MLNFTAGPVHCSETVKAVGGRDVPYFRTPEFSEVMLENERMIKKLAGAGEGARAVFLTGSGTAAMEAAVLNSFGAGDKVLVVNGGTFGDRFVQICEVHGIPFTELRPGEGKTVSEEMLKAYDRQGFTGMLVNLHETSTGVYYDPAVIGRFCKRNGICLIVDAISSFLADSFDMDQTGADMVIVGSQKALACPPGISAVIMSERAVARVESSRVRSLYFDMKQMLWDGERGQTPYTPAVGILLQLHARLKEIDLAGGAETEQMRIARLAAYFRNCLRKLPLDIFPELCSNAVTAVAVRGGSAYDVFVALKDEYGIWICPNAGQWKDRIFRVGHMGELDEADYDRLSEALHALYRRGVFTE